MLSLEDWSNGAREVAALRAQQQCCSSPGAAGRAGKQQMEESSYESGLTLVDSGSDPRAWLAPASGNCETHEYLRHSPYSSNCSYNGENAQLLRNVSRISRLKRMNRCNRRH